MCEKKETEGAETRHPDNNGPGDAENDQELSRVG